MLKSLRASLYTTAVAMTPFLLAACGDDGSNDKKASALLMTLALLTFAATMARRSVARPR